MNTKVKKIINFVLLSSIFFSSEVKAENFYMALDVFNSSVEHMYNPKTPANGNVGYNTPSLKAKSDDTYGVGVGVGYRLNLDAIYLAPELFYDYIDSKSNDPFCANGEDVYSNQDRINLNYRFGGKLNLGLNIFNKLDLYVNYGLSYVDYDINWNGATKVSRGHLKDSDIIGGGISYNFSENIAVRAAYDRQNLNLRYIHSFLSLKTTLETYRLGLVYKF